MKIRPILIQFILFMLLACIDRVNVSLPSSELPIVVEGFVSDTPGPYTVRISKALPVDGGYHAREAVSKARVVITDDAGGFDFLTESASGIYLTDSLQGVIGRSYKLSITTLNGLKFESTIEKMLPAGTIDRVYFEFVPGSSTLSLPNDEGFNVYVDATTEPGSDRRMRWNWNGTYKLNTDPTPFTCG